MSYLPRQQNSTSYPIEFLMTLAVDHTTAATGKAVAVTIAKNGAASFGAASGAVTEMGNGWYALAGNAGDRDTLGGCVFHCTATGCDPQDFVVPIVTIDLFSAQGGLTLPANFTLLAIDASGRVDLGKILGAASAGAAGYVGTDQSKIANPTSTVDLSGTTIKNVDNAIAAVTLVATTTAVTNDVGITQAGADKVWASAARTLTAFGFTVNAAITSVASGAITAAAFAANALDAVWSTTARTITDLPAALLALFFTRNTTKTYADSVDGSIVKEIAANATTSPATIAGAVWGALRASYAAPGTFGEGLGLLLARLGAFTGTGVNTVLGFFQAALSKSATLPSDIGGTFAPAMDSTEALAEAIGTQTDPLASAVPGAYAVGTAGYDIGQIPSIKANLIPGTVFVSPVAQDGVTTTLYVSRDYLVTNSQQLDYPIPNLAPSDVITWSVTRAGQAPLVLTGAYVAASPSPYARVQPTAANTLTLAGSIGNQHLEILITNAAGNKSERVVGTCFVKGVNVV